MSKMSNMSNRPDYDSWLTKEEAALFLDVSGKTVARLAAAQAVQKGYRKRPGLPPVAVYHPGDLQRTKTSRAGGAVDTDRLTPEIREFLENFTREIYCRKENIKNSRSPVWNPVGPEIIQHCDLLDWIEEELGKLLNAVSSGTQIASRLAK